MTAGSTRPYQRRRHRPIKILVSVLAAVALITWTVVLVSAGGPGGEGRCPAPAGGPAVGDPLAGNALDAVRPSAPGAVHVRVVNGGGQRGQANLVAAQLGDLGFAQGAPPGNDPFYPDGSLDCVGQIRFGKAGEPGASALALVIPCAELVRDARTDATVDVAVGSAFRDVNPGKSLRAALSHLAAPAGGNDGAGNADPGAADAPQQPLPRGFDPATRQAARSASC